MSKPISKKHGSDRSEKTEKSGSGHKGLTIIILLCFLGIMPILIWVSLPETSTYTVVTTTNAMVQSAAAAAGLEICTQSPQPVPLAGAENGVLYQLAADCSSLSAASAVQVLTVGFTSTDSMNFAIASAQETHKNWETTNTAAFMSGTSVIVIQGATGNEAVQQVGNSLIDQGAVRII